MDFVQVVRQMLAGVDIALIDPDIYPYLIPYIGNFMDKYRAEFNSPAIKKLEFYRQYIMDYKRKKEISDLLRQTPPPPKIIPPALTPEQVEHEVDLIWSSNIFKTFPEDQLELIIARFRQKRSEFIEQGDYINAQKADRYSHTLLSHCQLGEVENMQHDRVVFLQDKTNEAKDDLRNLKAKWETLQIKLRETASKKLKQMQEKHNEEIQDLEIMRSEIPLNRQKHSIELLQLRKRQAALVKSRRFADADEIKIQADKLEAQENEANKQKWNEEIDARIKNALQNQQKELMARKAYWKNEETSLIAQANKEIATQEKAIEHLENNKNNTQHAMVIATNLKNETKKTTINGLPFLENNMDERQRTAAHGQRRILNKKIYSKRKVKSSFTSPRNVARRGTM